MFYLPIQELVCFFPFKHGPSGGRFPSLAMGPPVLIFLGNHKDVKYYSKMFVLLLQPFPPPSPPTRRVRPTSGPSPSPPALAGCGFSLSPTRATVAKASKFHMSPTMVSHHQHSSHSDSWARFKFKNRLLLGSSCESPSSLFLLLLFMLPSAVIQQDPLIF